MKTVYLDNNATTQVAPEVLEAMLPYFRDLYGNPSSMHFFGGQVAREIRAAREQMAALIGAMPEEIIFTSCGTESDNAAIRSALATNPNGRHIVAGLSIPPSSPWVWIWSAMAIGSPSCPSIRTGSWTWINMKKG
ncbi:MAG: cysteine desulfurase [Thermodesulfobacteriota bacterium]|nr:cysteine desulfurase [Thermodesulfobacteriota bacterium]